jgi:1L-myo-inositol 1-phosphate cytidylyltransferase / CDP-L-myo-inositol myo-inositolphosphotransferase
VRRNVLSAGRAGIDRVIVVTPAKDEMSRLLDKTPASLLAPGERVPALGRVIVLAGHVLADSQWLKMLTEMPLERDTFYRDSDLAAVLYSSSGRDLAIGHCSEEFFAMLDRQLETNSLPPDLRGRFVLTSPDDTQQAQDWLLERLIKSGDSFLTRQFGRRISLALSRRLVYTAVTPNQITLVSSAIGLLSAPFFLSSQAAWQFAGGSLFLIHSIIDGCDGELARLKFQASRQGMILDMWGDNLVHAAVFSCMGIGWSLSARAAWPLSVAALAVAGTLGTAWLVCRQTLRWTSQRDIPAFTSVVRTQTSALSRLINALGNRDFIYGVLALSLFGKAHWLLPLVALGSPLFSLGLLCLSNKTFN